MQITEKDLEDGEVICDKCNGTGSTSPASSRESIYYQICHKCHGVGKLDWVERIMGAKKIDPWDNIKIPLVMHAYPKLIAEELVGVQPMDAPELMKFFRRRSKWQRAVTYLQDLKPWQRLLTIFSKGKEGDGTTTSQENTSPLF